MGKDTLFSKKQTLNLAGRLYFPRTPAIMGILNLTPDSFYDGGRYGSADDAVAAVRAMVENGADMIDVGACSTRPGAQVISEKEEWSRLQPLLERLRKEFPSLILSLDTSRAGIVRKASGQYHIQMVNDITAGMMDPQMPHVAAELGLSVLIMHMRGTPASMQSLTEYSDLMAEMIEYFHERISCFREAGVNDLIIDPGFGFAKTLDQNYEILARLDVFSLFGLPVCVGLSRKSMIYRLLDTTPDDSLVGSSVLHALAMLRGADILRVHDVRETVQVRTIIRKILDNR